MVDALKRLAPLVALLAIGLAMPASALGHVLSGRVETPLPLAVYLVGAGAAVALSFLLLIARDVRARVSPPSPLITPVPRAFVLVLRAAGLLGWCWIVAQAVIGGSSDADVATLFLWVYGWVGLAILCALVGPIWTWLDPFASLYDSGAAGLRALHVTPWERASYPVRLAQWPAVAGLAFFVWLELAYRGSGLGWAMVGYTGLTLVAMAQYGRDEWRQRGETFSVWFATLGRLAPIELVGPAGSRRIRRRRFASGLLGGAWTVPLVVLVAIGTGSILYDGLSQTELWFRLFGVPSLPYATLELAGFLAIIVLLVLAVARVVGLAAVGAGLLPIALGYLVAHYLTYLLGDGQRIVIAISDPFQLGWDLFGTAFYEPNAAWLPPVALWTIQLAAVVGGHVLGAWSGHVVAVSTAPAGRDVRLRQLPLAVLMVGLTAATLWSLGQAVIRDPGTTASVRPPAEVPVAKISRIGNT